jgi:hypothetical protein
MTYQHHNEEDEIFLAKVLSQEEAQEQMIGIPEGDHYAKVSNFEVSKTKNGEQMFIVTNQIFVGEALLNQRTWLFPEGQMGHFVRQFFKSIDQIEDYENRKIKRSKIIDSRHIVTIKHVPDKNDNDVIWPRVTKFKKIEDKGYEITQPFPDDDIPF